MKKLLLVLMVVAMASFLLVGCLPGVTPEPEPEPEPEALATIAVAKEYTNAAGVTFVACGKDVVVTLPTAVAPEYVVYVAQKVFVGLADGVEVYEYKEIEAATPNADRTVWTAKKYTTVPVEEECVPICLVALVKHPCCPGEEVALRVVTVDCTPPVLDLFVKFTDCEDVCVIPDPCVPEVPGAYMQWTSRTTGLCETVDCCKDACSGVDVWSLVIDYDLCLGPCDTETGTGCPVEGAFECGCLAYDDPATELVNEGIHYVDFSFEDNVGNAVESTWKLTFDTGSIITFNVGTRDTYGVFVAGDDISATLGWYTVYDLEGCPLPTFK